MLCKKIKPLESQTMKAMNKFLVSVSVLGVVAIIALCINSMGIWNYVLKFVVVISTTSVVLLLALCALCSLCVIEVKNKREQSVSMAPIFLFLELWLLALCRLDDILDVWTYVGELLAVTMLPAVAWVGMRYIRTRFCTNKD